MKLTTIDITFEDGESLFNVRYSPIEKRRGGQKLYSAIVYLNDKYLYQFETTGFANKTNAKQLILTAIEKVNE